MNPTAQLAIIKLMRGMNPAALLAIIKQLSRR